MEQIEVPDIPLEVEVPCYRCVRQGYGEWLPNNGVCYKCGGKGVFLVNIPKSLYALNCAREDYRVQRQKIRECTDEQDLTYMLEDLMYIKSRGEGIRQGLMSAGCPPEIIKLGYWPNRRKQ